MIVEEHLNHCLGEILYQNNAIKEEIAEDKVKMKGINVGESGEAFVSFEYLQEKSATIDHLVKQIVNEMREDGIAIAYICGMIMGWAAIIQKAQAEGRKVNLVQLAGQMQDEARRLAEKYTQVDVYRYFGEPQT